jgi:hypothetical protein
MCAEFCLEHSRSLNLLLVQLAFDGSLEILIKKQAKPDSDDINFICFCAKQLSN